MELPRILRRVKHRGWPIHRGERNLNAVVERRSRVPGRRDDLIHLLYDLAGQLVHHRWPCSSVPSVNHLERPLHPGGTAVWADGYHELSHMIGTHNGRIALVATRKLPVVRDTNRDAVVDPTVPDMAAGIYIHDGRDSAGCVTAATPTIEELVYLVGLAGPYQGPRLSFAVLDPESSA